MQPFVPVARRASYVSEVQIQPMVESHWMRFSLAISGILAVLEQGQRRHFGYEAFPGIREVQKIEYHSKGTLTQPIL